MMTMSHDDKDDDDNGNLGDYKGDDEELAATRAGSSSVLHETFMMPLRAASIKRGLWWWMTRRSGTLCMIATDIFCVCIYLNLFVLLINRTRTFLKGMAERSPHFWQIMQNSFTSNFASIRRGWEKSAREILWRCGSFWSFWHHVCGASPHPSPPQPARSRYDLAKSTKRHQVSFTASQPSYLHTVHHTFSALHYNLHTQLAEHEKCSLTPNTLNTVHTLPSAFMLPRF